MNKFTFLICAFVFITNIYAQETSITVDNQIPGWLSSLLTYSQQQSVEELTVTGYVNKADMNFINGLIKNRNLKILDLGNVNLAVTSYGDGVIWLGFLSYGEEKELQKIIMPQNIDGIYSTGNSNSPKSIIVSPVDTLVVTNRDISVLHSSSGPLYSHISYYLPRCVIFTEGVEVIPDYLFSFSQNPDGHICNVNLCNTIKQIGAWAFSDCSFGEPLVLPNSIEYLGKHPLEYDSYYHHYGLRNRWWQTTSAMPISSNRFDFPKQLKCYNSLSYSTMSDGSTRDVFSQDYFNSDTIVVYENCDTLFANLNAHIAYFYSRQPFSCRYAEIKIDTLYVPENSGDAYTNAFKYHLQDGRIKSIKEMMTLIGIDVIGESNVCYVDEEIQLNTVFTPSDAFDKRVVWSSENPEIASVDDKGLVKGIKAGETIIVATSVENDSIKGSFHIQVLQHVKGLTLNITEATIWNGDTIRITPIISPEDASNKNVEWKSNDQSVAIVEDGVVKGKSAGFAAITCTTEDGQFSAKCNITVKQQVENIRLSLHSLSLNVGESEHISADIYPVNASDKTLVWASSDNDIALVDNGLVTALKTGEVWIKASSINNNETVSDSCRVTVLQPVTGIKLNYSTYEMNRIGESVQLIATVLPEDASNKEVKWASSNESICIVSNGTVVATGFGTCVIIATTTDGNYIATCTVTVVEGADLPGDVNHDGEVNIADINALIDIILGGAVDEESYTRADVNCDGEVNIADINAVIDIILNN